MTDARIPGTKEPRGHTWLGNLDIGTILPGSGRALWLVDVICTLTIVFGSKKSSLPALFNAPGAAGLSGDRMRKCPNLGRFLQFRKSLNCL